MPPPLETVGAVALPDVGPAARSRSETVQEGARHSS
jgi:hypothetical protein